MKEIILGSDHGGFQLKEEIRKFLAEDGYKVMDFGAYSMDPVDYPDIALLVAEAVKERPDSFGIIIDGAGIGSAIVANKVPGIRAAVSNDLFTVKNSREHNDANILTLGARVIGTGLAIDIVKVFLKVDFQAGRHLLRVNKIMQAERKYIKDVFR